MRWLLVWLLLAGSAAADGERAGEFDYYVLSLSWSPNWCEVEGDAKGSDQCDPRHDHGWTLHGLWPQYSRGWPSFCRTPHPVPSRAMTADMADIMGTSGLAWYQWKKHGTCSGLSAEDYFSLSRDAFEKVTQPEVLNRLTKSVTLPARVIEEAFLRDNPKLEPDGITVTCKGRYIQEIRICLSRGLLPMLCGQDVVRDCPLTDALFAPVR
jgi:ribonuclease T2